MTIGDPHLIRRLFAAAYLSKSLAWSVVDLLMGYIIYKGMGFSAHLTVYLLFVFPLIGALSNVAIGALIDGLGTTRRVTLTAHLVGAVLTVVAALAQFYFSFDAPLFVVTGILFRVAFAVYDVPQTTMISLLPVTEADAGNYVRLRTALAAIGRLGVTVGNLILVGWSPAATRLTATIFLAACSLSIIITAAALLRAGKTDIARMRRSSSPPKINLPGGTGRLLISFMLAVSAMPLVSRLLIFAPGGSGPRWGAILLCTFTAGSVIGPLITPVTERRVGWRRAWLGSIALAVLTGDALAWTWIWPAVTAMMLALLHGIGLGMMGTLQWASASRLVRGHAARTGERTDGFLFGSVNFTIQSAIAIGALLMGPVLESFAAGSASASIGAILVLTLSGGAVATLLLDDKPLSVEATGR